MKRLSLWEVAALIDGWNEAHGIQKPPTNKEFEAAKREHGDD